MSNTRPNRSDSGRRGLYPFSFILVLYRRPTALGSISVSGQSVPTAAQDLSPGSFGVESKDQGLDMIISNFPAIVKFALGSLILVAGIFVYWIWAFVTSFH